MRWLVLLLLALGLLPAPARADDGYVYGLFFKGFACYEESRHFVGQKSDELFIVIFTQDSRGKVTRHKVLPGGKYAYFEAIDQGDVDPYEFLVWSGPVQTLDIAVQLWEYNRIARATSGVLLDVSTIAALAGAVVLSAAGGGPGGPGDAGVFLAHLSQDLKRDLEDKGADFLGMAKMQIPLHRVGTLGDRPTQSMRDATYDFHTTHRDNGAHYLLFWEVRRHRVR